MSDETLSISILKVARKTHNATYNQQQELFSFLLHYTNLAILVQGMSCDRFLGRTHAPRTSRLRCVRTRVRTPNLKWSHFAPALLVK